MGTKNRFTNTIKTYTCLIVSFLVFIIKFPFVVYVSYRRSRDWPDEYMYYRAVLSHENYEKARPRILHLVQKASPFIFSVWILFERNDSVELVLREGFRLVLIKIKIRIIAYARYLWLVLQSKTYELLLVNPRTSMGFLISTRKAVRFVHETKETLFKY